MVANEQNGFFTCKVTDKCATPGTKCSIDFSGMLTQHPKGVAPAVSSEVTRPRQRGTQPVLRARRIANRVTSQASGQAAPRLRVIARITYAFS